MNFNDIERFWSKIIKTGCCWDWLAYKDSNGYGRFGLNRKIVRAHQFSYVLHNGEIPKGLVIDHLCRNPSCCNPEHLEAVPQSENMKRGKIRSFHRNKKCCPKGHEYNKENTYYGKNNYRWCKTCLRENSRLQSKRRYDLEKQNVLLSKL